MVVDLYYYDENSNSLEPFNTARPRVIFTTTEPPPEPDPDPEPGHKLLLVTETTTLSVGHTALRDLLIGAGWEVIVRSWSDTVNYDDIAVVVVARGNPSGDAGRYLHPPVGIVGVDTWRTLGMGTDLGFLNNITDVEVTNPGSPLAAGVTGTFAAYQSGAYITWAPDTYPDMQVVVTRPGQAGQRVVFAYEAGSQMATRFATTRHVGMGYHENGLSNGLTQQAADQILAAVNWAAATTYVEPPPPPPPPDPGENLAMLVTSDELAMWQDRSVNGPFRVAGDFSANSPGHWSEMVNDANADWTTGRWTGPQELNTNGSVKKLGETSSQTANDPPTATQRMSHRLPGAAHVAIVNNNTALAQNIVNEIRWYSQQSRLDFHNRTLYPNGHFADLNPLFMMTIWVLPFVIAYDACRVLVPPDAEVENWFLGLADTCHGNMGHLGNVFPNRGSDNYTSRSSFVNTDLQASTRLANGNIVEHLRISRFYNNRMSDMAALQGLVGVLVNNDFHVAWAKRYIREYVMFANRTTANQWTSGDHNRGSTRFPQLGFSYDMGAFARMMPFIEALARTGDTSLYDFSSSEGSAHPTWGTNHFKTMKQIIEQRINTVDQTISAQYTDSSAPPSSSVAGDEFYRIKSRRSNDNREIVTDGMLICAAAYYNEPSWVDVINRVGTPTGFTNPPGDSGAPSGWMVDFRSRFLRSISSSPFGGS